MKKPKSTTPANESPTGTEPLPIFDPATARPIVPPVRHEPTARTAAFRQPAGDGQDALFSATRVFIALAPAEATDTQP